MKGHPSLVKDINTGAVLNINSDAIEKARMRKKKETKREEDISELKNDVYEIKKMLTELSKKMVE